MAKILILGGGFGGLVVAERLAEHLGDDHQITLVSRSRRFVFYPALVRLAFGECRPEDVTFDLRNAMLDRRVNFIEAEVARIDPLERRVLIAHGDVQGQLPYDYLVFALGRRLATERISGFYEYAHHLLDIDKALKFGKAIDNFHEGHAVIGQCAGARLPVPIYETAFALARKLEKRGERERTKITVVTPQTPAAELGNETSEALQRVLDSRGIEVLTNFAVKAVHKDAVITNDSHSLNFDLLMLLPPFKGSPAAAYVGIANDEGYVNVEPTLRVSAHERIYAVGDCANFPGPKMGNMAVRQGQVAAANLVAELNGREPVAHYAHEVKLVIDDNADESIFRHKDVVWPGMNIAVAK
ncbi:MAG TPA: FAD-dependent oxidoreductase [Pyrinomonadaceae bacterium]|nr:FAD-dependent oxidoreductase [Pyrinomonadaceae bacterium]